jgi:ethanolamine utilization protein
LNNQELVKKVYELVKQTIAKLEEDHPDEHPAAETRAGDLKLKPLILTSEHGDTCHQSLERLGGGCALQDDYKTELDGICCVVLYDLTLDNMFKLAFGCTDNAYTKVAAEALLKGKQVYALREGIELLKYNSNGPYFKSLNENLKKLQDCGVVIIAEADLDNIISGSVKAKPAAGEYAGAGTSIEVKKKVITEVDIRHAHLNGANEILILPKAILTSLADEYATKRGVTITRIDR